MRNLPGIVVLTALLLAACVATEPAPEPAATPAAPAYAPLDGASPRERFSQALTLLERGEPLAARSELELYLRRKPNSRVAKDLLLQIETPASEYFPAEFEKVTLGTGDSLSSLSKQYLGSVYKFHALAKYNDITEPQRIRKGQMIRIPLTDDAKAAFAGGSVAPTELEPAEEPDMPEPGGMPEPAAPTLAEEPVAPALAAPAAAGEDVATEEPAEPEPEPEPEEPRFTAEELAQIEALHKEALNAYRRQNLDKAIGLWDEVLALDPEHENARLYRSQATSLKKKLSNLN